jgi:single-strand DNA-binding protein
MLNKAQIIGNLGADPRIAKAQNGSAIAAFTVATTERGYTTQSGAQIPDRTEWHNVICFGKLAEVVAKYLHKGSKVYIEGKMRTRSYNGKDGIERKVMEINADSMEMLDSKQTSAVNNNVQREQELYGSPQPEQGYSQQQRDDDVPF